jgi:RNA polymerase sigma-70 factor (ECF subfamily)
VTPILTRRTAPSRTLERLYRHHARDVYRTALALLRNPQEAEDATQTAFLNAYRALMRGEKPREPRSWMLAIVHNVVRMRHRTLSRRPSEVPFEEEHEPASLEMPVDLEPVLEALSRLPLNQRAAIVMREVEGRSYAEIASVLGVTVSSVEALIFRARRNLRMNREALGVLSLAPLPASLMAASGASVGGIAALVGSDAVLKAAAVVVAGVVVGGAAIHAGAHAEAGTDRRPGPAVHRAAAPAAPPTAAYPDAVVVSPQLRHVRHRPAAAREAPVVVFTPVAATSGGPSTPAHPRVAAAVPKPAPEAPTAPTADPRRPASPPPTPRTPPETPPAQPPATTSPTPGVTPPLPVELPLELPAVPTLQLPVQAPQLPSLPVAPPAVATPILPPVAPLP